MSLLLLVTRHLCTAVAASLALGVVALLAAATASAVPRAVATMHAEQLAHAVAATSAVTRDVVSVDTAFPGYGSAFAPYHGLDLGAGDAEVDPPQPDLDGYLDGLRALAAAQPQPLAGVLGEPDVLVDSPRVRTALLDGNDVADPGVVLRAGATIDDQVDVVAGRLPRPTPVLADPSALLPGPDGVVDVEPVPVEVAMSQAAADELGWTVGSVHPTDDPLLPPLRLVGTWEPRDATADLWQHGPLAVTPEVLVDPNVGRIVTAAVLTDPGTLAAWVDGPTARTWYAVDATGVPAAGTAALLAQLRGFTATTSSVVEGDTAVLRPASGLVDVLATTLGQRRGVDAVVAVLAVGPAGALVAVLALAARLVVDQRRRALALLRARGASGTWARAVVAVEGLVVGLPGAALGLAAGLLVVPGAPGTGQVLAALACGAAPAVALALSAGPAGLRERRHDLGGSHPAHARARRWGEAAVVAAAAATTWLALDRGVVSGAVDGRGLDPVVVAAPLLVSLAAALLAVRAVPPVLHGVERALARRRDLVPFLGAARVRRDPAGGLVPAVALVLAFGTASSGVVLATTVRDAVTHEAWGEVGADVRVAGPAVDDATRARLDAVDGVAAVATVRDAGRLLLGDTPVTLYVASGALDRVQADVPGAPEDLDRLGTVDGTLPVVAAGDVGAARTLAGAAGPVGVDVVDTVDRLPGLPPTTAALLADADAAAALLGTGDGTARLALFQLDDDADRAAVEAAVTDLLPTAVVDDPLAGEEALLATPSAAGLRTAFVVAVVASGLLSAAAVVLALVLGTPARTRLLAVLRTLGLPRGAERGLVLWEVGPWVGAALVTGAVLAVAVPALVVGMVDLAPLTGADAAPSLVVDPWWLAALVAALLAVVAAGAWLAGLPGRRRTADHLRGGTD
ncbi:putative ABC transport system permease protein [Isoptericola jiangsuensis]|uniref:Putative ABC transport system permease protein n=1 Tax=Isoptericola jiangsuensis TaxID=548579 RepID=A0A2A9EUQ1_9MICO|nr:FtsX-like permease family protein [Isoptericola jiangsuensis]PFG42473.1 putative ABC transport system permease protein [Isoptericola jiangsuensis]